MRAITNQCPRQKKQDYTYTNDQDAKNTHTELINICKEIKAMEILAEHILFFNRLQWQPEFFMDLF